MDELIPALVTLVKILSWAIGLITGVILGTALVGVRFDRRGR